MHEHCTYDTMILTSRGGLLCKYFFLLLFDTLIFLLIFRLVYKREPPRVIASDNICENMF